jgi:hypothetical protein
MEISVCLFWHRRHHSSICLCLTSEAQRNHFLFKIETWSNKHATGCYEIYYHVHILLFNTRKQLRVQRLSNVKLKFTLEQARRPRGGVEKQLYSFFNCGARWSWVVNATIWLFYFRERPGTHCGGGWVDPRADKGGLWKSRQPPPTGIRSLDCPAGSKLLYRLSSPGLLRYVPYIRLYAIVWEKLK